MAGGGLRAAQISEAWLMPVLEAMLPQFPFRIRGFHSDNGSEFINHTRGPAAEQAARGAHQVAATSQPTTTDWRKARTAR